MKVIHLLRKPLSENTVASNVLKHGTGGLNIGASRLAYEEGHEPPKDANVDKPSSWTSEHYNGKKPYILNAKLKTRQVFTPEGRFPANLILQHFDECRCVGGKKVKGQNPKYVNEGKGSKAKGIYGELPARPAHTGIGHGDENGKETVANWICAEGCPVLIVDEQSGVSKSAGGRTANISTTSTIYGGGKGLGQDLAADSVRGDPGFGDVGGASRFFKQVGGSKE
tara:strand:+ start:3075 stop:3749 length:675 start_codon:yes stop_codon:yes gene_type:complete